MRNRPTARMLAVALVGLAALAGCGEEESDQDPKGVYIREADSICAVGTLEIGSESRKRFGSSEPRPAEQRAFAEEVVVPTLRTDVLAKLRALTPPEGDEQEVDAIWAALEDGIDELAASPELLAEENTGGAFDQANRLAREYGFSQCGSG